MVASAVSQLCYTNGMKRMFERMVLLLALLFLLPMTVAAEGAGETRFRLGPFFEWRSSEERMETFAIRPFFAWERSRINARDTDMEVVWPLTHFGWRGDEYHSRWLIAFYEDRDVTDRTTSDWSFQLPPLWMNGTDKGNSYWGLFPIYGHVPRMLFLEDFQWTLFPLWLRYRTAGSRSIYREYILWPFFSLKHDPDVTRWGLWPLFGTKSEPDFDSFYVAWPFYQSYDYHRRNHNGTGWMLWPLWMRIDTDTEQGWGTLSPLFSYQTTTDGAMRLRAPWPLFERYTDPKESTWMFWRFWGMTHRGTRDGWWFLHPITVSQRQKTENLYTRRFRVWPFYVTEENHGYDFAGTPHLQSRHWRIWPFFASSWNATEGLRRRSLVLFPIRDVPAVERNWAPFWTFYSAEQKPGSDAVRHELLWGLIKWTTHPGPFETLNRLEDGEED